MTVPHSERLEVSVVIPTRDRSGFLPRALKTALAQEDVDLEVIVVDDGSREPVPEASLEPRLRVVRHEVAHGVAKARNRGIAEARARWIAFLDDDDLWSPRKLRTQLDEAARGQASFVYAAGVVVDEQGWVQRTVVPPPPAEVSARILRWNFIGGPSAMLVRTDLLRELDGFDERFSVMADWDLWIRLAETGRAAACEEVLVAFSKHPGNMQVVDVERISDEFQLLLGKHDAARRARGVEPDELVFWRWVALGHLRAGRRLEAAKIFLKGAVQYRSVGNVLRAAGTVLGEPAMERVRGVVARDRATRPDWLPPEARSSRVF